ncbi:MAG TPA: inositol monophosphatase family protein [Planctomycetaceae bacterium]|nr:inositol monophosphatase family protein [Planctomycetaceae bacterium]
MRAEARVWTRSQGNLPKPSNLEESASTGTREPQLFALNERRRGLTVDYDESGSPTTNVDRSVTALIQKHLAAMGYDAACSGEEIDPQQVHSKQLEFVIDGIDGTRNLRDGNWGWCVSVAAVFENVPVVGVVYDPCLNQMYSAATGHGASLTVGEARSRLEIPTSCPSDFSFSVGSFRHGAMNDEKRRLIEGIKALGGRGREWGSVALSICGVARGGLGVYVQNSSKRHDHIAALVIASEAGAAIQERVAKEPLRSRCGRLPPKFEGRRERPTAVEVTSQPT